MRWICDVLHVEYVILIIFEIVQNVCDCLLKTLFMTCPQKGVLEPL